MSYSPNLKTILLYVIGFTFFSLAIFAFLEAWHASAQEEKYIEIEQNLTREISELEVHIVELENSLIKRNQEIIVRDQLIEEKNEELEYLNREVAKWKFKFFEQGKNLEADTPAVAVSL